MTRFNREYTRFNSNYGSALHYFRDTATYRSYDTIRYKSFNVDLKAEYTA